jgi:hypothetical protein
MRRSFGFLVKGGLVAALAVCALHASTGSASAYVRAHSINSPVLLTNGGFLPRVLGAFVADGGDQVIVDVTLSQYQNGKWVVHSSSSASLPATGATQNWVVWGNTYDFVPGTVQVTYQMRYAKIVPKWPYTLLYYGTAGPWTVVLPMVQETP